MTRIPKIQYFLDKIDTEILLKDNYVFFIGEILEKKNSIGVTGWWIKTYKFDQTNPVIPPNLILEPDGGEFFIPNKDNFAKLLTQVGAFGLFEFNSSKYASSDSTQSPCYFNKIGILGNGTVFDYAGSKLSLR